MSNTGLFKYAQSFAGFSCPVYENFTALAADSVSFAPTFFDDAIPRSIYVNQAGTTLLGLVDGLSGVYSGIDYLAGWTLSSAYTISTAGSQTLKDITASISGGLSAFWPSHDGSYIYVATTNYTTVYAFALSTPWDVSTATLNHSETLTNMFGVTGSANRVRLLSVDAAGTSGVYGRGLGSDYRAGNFTLSTAFDLTTMTVTETATTGIPASTDVPHVAMCENRYAFYNGTTDLYLYKFNAQNDLAPLANSNNISFSFVTGTFGTSSLLTGCLAKDRIYMFGRDNTGTPVSGQNRRIESFTLS